MRDIAFLVEDADHAFNEAVKRGATAHIEPHDWKDENGSVRKAAIHTYGDTIHSFLSYSGSPRVSKGANGNGANTRRQPYGYRDVLTIRIIITAFFCPDSFRQKVEGEDVGIVLVDHIVGNVELGKMNFWCDFYRDVMGFERYITFDDKDISTEYSSLMSIVMSDGGHNIKFPINEPAEGKGGKSQIQEYIDFYRSAGAQHVALLCKDVRASVKKLKANGIEFLTVPDTYYDELPNRVGEIDEDINELKELGILVDRDDEGYLLQIFTKPVEDRPTVFYEILQRKGCKGFGKGNFKALFVSIEEEQRRRGNL